MYKGRREEMSKKIWKCKAYKGTEVNYIKSQEQINKLLNNNGINDIQHTRLGNQANIMFIKELKIETKIVKVGVKVTLPDIDIKVQDQLYRALFYYLKAKFESLTFGFVEEYNEAFVKEFMPYLVADKTGRTVADVILPKLVSNANIIGNNEQLYLEDKEENELGGGEKK
jgi:hypothetical protein